jgi:hypothetical protein
MRGVFLSSLFRVFPITDPESKKPTLYFAFPDLAVRAIGEFRLRFTLSFLGREYGRCITPYSWDVAAPGALSSHVHLLGAVQRFDSRELRGVQSR